MCPDMQGSADRRLEVLAALIVIAAGLATAGQAAAQATHSPAGSSHRLPPAHSVGQPTGPGYQRVPIYTAQNRAQRPQMPAVATRNAIQVSHAFSSPESNDGIVKTIQKASQRMEMTVNSSRILKMESKIPRVVVNNPEVLTATPLSPNEIQISATQPGVTQVNLWDEEGKIYTIDVSIYGDVGELQMALKDQFPHSAVRVHRYSNSLMLSGFVDRPDHVSGIMRLAEDYSPKVINNMSVGGVQQILLNVQVMEVSRTKLRNMGFDFANINGDDFVVSGVSNLIQSFSTQQVVAQGDTVRFGIVNDTNSFFGFLEALRQNDLMKILAEPKLVTVSGRPASFNVGGEFPVLVPQTLGTVSIEYKKFGTQVDFVPLVLGNGNIRLEVRPRVSEIDSTRSVTIQDFEIPGLRVREADTGVEMKPGQTLAMAGLVQTRVEAFNRGLPVLADLPWIGAAFRSVQHENNEIELLILVRPELVEAMDPHEVPPGGPGLDTCDPTDGDLYLRGFLEVPCCDHCGSSGCSGCAGRGAPNYQHVPPFGPSESDDAARSQPPEARRRGSRARLSSHLQGDPVADFDQRARESSQRMNRYHQPIRQTSTQAGSGVPQPPGMIGPIGYDVLK